MIHMIIQNCESTSVDMLLWATIWLLGNALFLILALLLIKIRSDWDLRLNGIDTSQY